MNVSFLQCNIFLLQLVEFPTLLKVANFSEIVTGTQQL